MTRDVEAAPPKGGVLAVSGGVGFPGGVISPAKCVIAIELRPRYRKHLEDGGMLGRELAVFVASIGLRSPPQHDETNGYRKE
jgi:hypothetical protein